MTPKANSLTILIVDDEPQIRRLLKLTLSESGFRLIEAETGKQALLQAATAKPDVIILDLGLPDIDGQAVIAQLREWSSVPIIILSVRDEPEDKILALDNGADDYLTKPFDSAELVARIRAVTRRTKYSEGDPNFTDGQLLIDFTSREVFVDHTDVHLTPIEYSILKTLAQAGGKIVTQTSLLRAVWGPQATSHGEYVRVHLAHLRKKLGKEIGQKIKTESGIGYRYLPYPGQK